MAGTLPRTESGAVTPSGTVEKGVEGYAGKGSVNGLPSVSDAGVITMTYHQVRHRPRLYFTHPMLTFPT